ncbi:hypothetical protein [Spiroplasma endosymbiont of Danaus chrysippus]|uniref:hypothetical protein n=1 Tax=Spiroplasma endosymbiont of Danaus chrysippus TaxID=2691041 RepID=UPI0013CBE101|nr:hypothetical protein [Spiroplasma endosymbiont of Danaus chrysippus]CAB1054690.1 hypothetical protein [Spiroplasma endosymbiont of Danaus chrysippus]
MNKEKILEYYNNEIKTYKEQIEELEKKLSVLVEVISNSQSMIEKINGGQFDE